MTTKPTEPRRTLLFLDVATTSYRPQCGTILEAAAILADAETLDVLDTRTWLIKHDSLPDDAPDFHAELVEACRTDPRAISMGRFEGELIAWPGLKADAVCNRNMYFDRQSLQAHVPQAAKYVPRVEVEINGLEVLARAAGAAPFVPAVARTYRAGDDVVDAYEATVYYLGFLKGVK